MKKKHLLIFAGLFLFSLHAISQNTANLIIFSEDGDPFCVFVNGVKQNNNPETNVKITGLSSNASVRVEFENKALPQLKQTMLLEPGFEHTARIKRDKNKQLKLRYFGQVPLSEAKTGGIATTEYHTADNSSTDKGTSHTYNTTSSDPASGTSSSGTQIVPAKTSPEVMGVGVTSPQININITGIDPTSQSTSNGTTMQTNMNTSDDAAINTYNTSPPVGNVRTDSQTVEVNMSGIDPASQTSSQVTIIQTESSSSVNSISNPKQTSSSVSQTKNDSPPAAVGITMMAGNNMNGTDPSVQTSVRSTSSSTITKTSVSSSSSSDKTVNSPAPASTACASAMSAANFSSLKKSVESKPFSDTKMSTAKVATKNSCLSVNQVKEICKLFTMDDDKLVYAKYAYDRCVDKANYYQVSEVFSFSSTVNDFNNFLEK